LKSFLFSYQPFYWGFKERRGFPPRPFSLSTFRRIVKGGAIFYFRAVFVSRRGFATLSPLPYNIRTGWEAARDFLEPK